MEPAAPSPFALLPLRESREAGGNPAGTAGTADLPSAVPVPLSMAPRRRKEPRSELIGALRLSIEAIERPVLARPGPRAGDAAWCLGADDPLVPHGLETDSVHEVKPVHSGGGASAGDWMAGLGFALRLAVRRLEQVAAEKTGSFVLWCWPRVYAGEFGRPSAHGLAALGLDPARLLMVETAREAEALGALEEGLRSGAAALAIGVFEEVALNPARRLSLAALAHAVPCLIVTHPGRAPAAATATRWRIARAPSAAHPFDARAAGQARFSAGLERCRAHPQSAHRSPLLLEWSDETHAFRMAARLAGRASRPRRAGRGAAE